MPRDTQMTIIPHHLFSRLWDALVRCEPLCTSQHQIDEHCRKIVENGWATHIDIEELLDLMDLRIGDLWMREKESLTTLLDLSLRNVYNKPAKRASGVMDTKGLSAADTAALLIGLEELGASIDPWYLVQYILPSINNKKLLSDSELSIFWFLRVRNRMSPLTFRIDKKPTIDSPPTSPDTWERKTRTGYKIQVIWDDDYATFTVNSPKYRVRARPVKTLCPDCGWEYFRGDRQSTDLHRSEHKQRMYYLDPKPHAKFLAVRDNEKEPELVICKSPAWKHKEVYIRAQAFRREFSYDFTQWKSGREDDPDARGYIFADLSGAILGACAFRLRGSKSDQRWGLQWIWICPKARRKGVLRQRWQNLRERFGDFQVESPVSKGMMAFLEAMGDEHLVM
jgi:hypothetical protein